MPGNPEHATSSPPTNVAVPPLPPERWRWTGWAVSALLLGHACVLAFSASRQSPTLNEPAHLVAGLIHWTFRRFDVYQVNPPLVHYVSAIPVMVAGYRSDWSGFYNSPGARPEFRMGERFIRANRERSVWLFVIARWACLPFSLLGAVFCFCWSRELWGRDAAGILSLCVWCIDPNIIAYGQLITPDCASSSLGLGASFLFWRWLKSPTWKRAIAAGVVLGLAELSKTVWVMLFGLWPMLWLFWSRTGDRGCHQRTRSRQMLFVPWLRAFGQLSCILLLALYVLNLGYGFNGTLTRLGDFTFVSRALTGRHAAGEPGNRFSGSWAGDIPVPLPLPYVQGIDLQKKDFESYDFPSYLRGEWKDGGWWYYYIYGLAVKSPHGLQLLLLLAMGALIYRGWRATGIRAGDHSVGGHDVGARGSMRSTAAGADVARQSTRGQVPLRDLAVLGAPALAVLLLVSSQLEFNHHFRYVLPVIGFATVLIGAAVDPVARSAQTNQHDRDASSVTV